MNILRAFINRTGDNRKNLLKKLENIRTWAKVNEICESEKITPVSYLEIDSELWWWIYYDKDGTHYRINPEWDIIEILINWKTHQLFNQESALRESKKLWKNIRTKQSWKSVEQEYWKDWTKLNKELWVVFGNLAFSEEDWIRIRGGNDCNSWAIDSEKPENICSVGLHDNTENSILFTDDENWAHFMSVILED